MKKMLFLLVMIAAFAACSNDDNSITLDKKEVILKSDETYTIIAKSESPLTYKSNNKYVATVSNEGIINAQRIGEAQIIISDGKDEETVKVKVNPVYNLYTEPFHEFETSKSSIIAKFGKPDLSQANAIAYKNTSSKAPVVMYFFDEDDKLNMVGVMISSQYTTEISGFLNERYAAVGYFPSKYTFAYVNGLNKESITMGVGAYLYDVDAWVVMYFPYTVTKSNINHDVINPFMGNCYLHLVK